MSNRLLNITHLLLNPSNWADIQLVTTMYIIPPSTLTRVKFYLYYVCQVYTWGHRLVTPKRVLISRNLRKSGSTPLKFHRWERLHVVAIAAGMVHSVALTDDGALFYWTSSDPDLRCQQVLFD